ncbi:MAG: sensor histidine kinase [Ruminococcus sp.]|nr:sensor histidine kinase [Ruminococcus sp.]
MLKKQEGTILAAYLKEHLKAVVIYGAIVAVFLGLAGLYGYEVLIDISYAAIIIAFLGAVYGAWDYAAYRRKCKLLLEALYKNGERAVFLADNLSYAGVSGGAYTGKLYQELLEKTETETRKMISEYDAARRDMEDYYTMWTHQIKTPIAALRLLLQDEKQPLEELFKIEQYAEMALQYARLESLSSDYLFKEEDISEIIRKAVKKYAILFIGSGLGFTLEKFSAHAVTDEKWLTFVMEQILSNALKYTSEGQIMIYGLDENGEKIQDGSDKEASFVVIEDSGIGIRSEDLPRIFEKGYTGYNGRVDKKSTGIGLYLCKQIMDRLSHTIRVESQVGQGTKVILGFARANVT